jgi:hypothetical protein
VPRQRRDTPRLFSSSMYQYERLLDLWITRRSKPANLMCWIPLQPGADGLEHDQVGQPPRVRVRMG